MIEEPLIERLKKIPRVKSETEYWNAHKIFKRALTKYTMRLGKMLKSPSDYMKDYEDILNEGVRIGVISEEFAVEKKQHMMKELTSPTRFKADASDLIEKAKNKLTGKK